MENITFEKCIFYDRKNNRTYIPESLLSLKLFQQLANSWFYNAFKSALSHAQEASLKVENIGNLNAPIKNQIEGFAIIFTDNSAMWMFSDNTKIIDAVKFQRDILACMEKKNILGSRELFTDYVLELLNDYMRNPAISYDELCEIYKELHVEEYADIEKEQIEHFKEKKKQIQQENTTFLSAKEYDEAISFAEKEFNSKGLNFYGGNEDEENQSAKAIVTPEIEDLIYQGVILVTFTDQKSFDTFIKTCKCHHVVGTFDISPKIWKYKKYFYFKRTDGNRKLCSTNVLNDIMYDGIVNGEIFKL